MVTVNDYPLSETAWCPGCGNFGIRLALRDALVELGLAPHQILLVSGVGQAAKLPMYMSGNSFTGLHGRSLPAAQAFKLVNPALKIFVFGGDGDGYAEGGNHLLHAIRRNVDLTYIVHNNQVFGLTKGQASPTSLTGYVGGITPQGTRMPGFNPIPFAISMDIGFVARSFSGDKDHLVAMIKAASKYNGFALIDVLQPCVTFNKVNTYKWYKDRVYYLPDDYDPTDKELAFRKSQEFGERIPLGIIYQSNRPAYTTAIDNPTDDPVAFRPHNPADFTFLNKENEI
ncbi:MAG TPA: 2-oxoacid:ferredoxin oxidoreductase subunit beta [Firmicutes bacterium]|nr:2-oxoacid:ferredoxin oxidoreductase subunit beta [Bacillota bacterium]